MTFFIKDGYTAREAPEYFTDTLTETLGIVHQPDVYPFASHLARRLGCTYIIDVGCGRAVKLLALRPEFQVIGIDMGSNLDVCRQADPSSQWIDWDLEGDGTIPIEPSILERSLVVCSDVIEHLKDPRALLRTLKGFLEHCPAALVTTPERDLVRGESDAGPPANPSHVREWNLAEFTRLLEHSGAHVGFVGLTVNNDRDLRKRTIAAILENPRRLGVNAAPPADFKVVALMTAFNEEDVIGPSLRRLIDQGIDVYVIENWSTDRTYDIAKEFLGRGVIGLERFPATGAVDTYQWRALLGRVEELGQTLDADWFIHHDVDEIRESPWAGVSLRDGIYRVDRAGFNAIDHTLLIFSPTDDGFAPGTDFGGYFSRCEFGTRRPHFVQIKAWKRTGQRVSLSPTGGHEAAFDNRRVYPYKFLLRHYPVRSQGQGERKVLRDRHGRWDPEERRMGWHVHYDHVKPAHDFLARGATLPAFNPATFASEFLVERLSGVGIVRDQSASPPPLR